MNNDYKKTQAELAIFLHVECFSPVKSTFIKAVNNGNFVTWPGLMAKLIDAHLQKLEVNMFGHLVQTRKNTRSKNSKRLALDIET